MKKAAIILVLFCTAVFAQQKGSFTDPRDKKTYKTVKIGEQVWMAENLNYAAKGSKCYDNKSANCNKYGRLYDLETANNACPTGWHLPVGWEWNELYNYVDSTSNPMISTTAGKHLKAKSGWKDPCDGDDFCESYSSNGNDTYGFLALPGGNGGSDGNFAGIGMIGIWWGAIDSYNMVSNQVMFNSGETASWISYNKDNKDMAGGLNSVRCLQDRSVSEEVNKISESSYFTDSRDDRKYKTVKIGTQTWMAENLDYNANSSKCYENSESNCKTYGRLYDWSTAKNACPTGWHLPDNLEWSKLYRYADGTNGTDSLYNSPYNSKTAGKYLKAKEGWNNGNGMDTYGFSALPGGYWHSSGKFYLVSIGGSWWSASEYYGRGYSCSMGNIIDFASCGLGFDKSCLFSIRCIKD